MESFDNERSDYEVGYRKPPKHSRFKKGQSGNPSGKLPGTKNFATLIKQDLLAPVVVQQNGHRTKTTKLRVMVTRFVHQAMQGDYASTRLLLRYAGLGRLLNEPKQQHRGPSQETIEMIRAVSGESCRPERRTGSEPKLETLRTAAYPEQESRSRSGILGQSYQVGYGKPPTHTRFQKGRSGNPAGRPIAPRSIRKLILQLLDEEVSVTENGQKRVLSRLEVILIRIVNKATMGDQKFLALLLEYTSDMDVKLRRRRRLPANSVEKIRKSFLIGLGILDSAKNPPRQTPRESIALHQIAAGTMRFASQPETDR
jgi:hypothetical protein